MEPGDRNRRLPSGHDYVVENIAVGASRRQGTAVAGLGNQRNGRAHGLSCAAGHGGTSVIRFVVWDKGKPNDAALPSFRFVNPRTCENIWHHVRATVTSRDGKVQYESMLIVCRQD